MSTKHVTNLISQEDAKAFRKRAIYGKLHRGSLAINELMEHHSYMLGLSMFLRFVDDTHETEIPGGINAEAWSDGKAIHFAPSYGELTLYEQTAVLTKHLLKTALCHIPRARRLIATMGDRFQVDLYTLASDLVCHEAMSSAEHIARLQPTLSEVIRQHAAWCEAMDKQAPKFAPAGDWTTERTYRFLEEWREDMTKHLEADPDSKEGQKFMKWLQDVLGRLKFNMDLKSDDAVGGKSLDEQQKSDFAEMREWRRRMGAAMAGDKPGGILRRISSDLPEVKTPWQKLLRMKTCEAVTRRPRPDWNRLSRSMTVQLAMNPFAPIAFTPGRGKNSRAPRIGLGFDTSGSMTGALIDLAAANLEAVQRAYKTELLLVIGDAKVEEVLKVEPHQLRDICRKVQWKGGGGTDFRPLFEELVAWKPDVIIFFTDLEGAFPAKAPKCPVYWGVLGRPGMSMPKVPFGTIIQLD